MRMLTAALFLALAVGVAGDLKAPSFVWGSSNLILPSPNGEARRVSYRVMIFPKRANLQHLPAPWQHMCANASATSLCARRQMCHSKLLTLIDAGGLHRAPRRCLGQRSWWRHPSSGSAELLPKGSSRSTCDSALPWAPGWYKHIAYLRYKKAARLLNVFTWMLSRSRSLAFSCSQMDVGQASSLHAALDKAAASVSLPYMQHEVGPEAHEALLLFGGGHRSPRPRAQGSVASHHCRQPLRCRS